MSRPEAYHLTKIVATLGPASDSKEMIGKLVDAGANLFRLNFSHGTHERHALVIKLIRQIEEEKDTPLGIIADLQGPKLRVANLPESGVPLVAGKDFDLVLDDVEGSDGQATLPHPEIYGAAVPGSHLLLDDGKMKLEIVKVAKDKLATRIVEGGLLKPNKGVNYPAHALPISALTDKDRADLDFAIANGADWIALSFVQKVEDLQLARELIANRARLIAKIEKPGAIDNFADIVEHCDAVMIARGDLAIEISYESVPSLQKQLIKRCRSAGKPVIVATQMLESMIEAATPTRAETSDVATALYDGTDAVMLSAESASGKHPVEAVDFMRRIIKSTEDDPAYREAIGRDKLDLDTSSSVAIVAAACTVAEVVNASAIVSFSKTGNTTLRASRQRPVCPLLGLTPIAHTARMATLFWGVRSIKTPDLESNDEMVVKASSLARKYGFAADGDRLIVTAGIPLGVPGHTNILRLAVVGEDD